MNDFVPPDKPAYGVPETVDYTTLTNLDTPDETENLDTPDHELPDEPYSFEHEGDGPGFDSEDDLPDSDYPEVGEDHDDDSV